MALASNLVLTRLQKEEGFRGDFYDDETGERIVPGYTLKGNPTIGYGFAFNKDPMTIQQALSIMLDKLIIIEKWCTENLEYWPGLDINRQSSIIDMCYQMGCEGWKGFTKANFYIGHNDWNNAYHEILASDYATKFPNRATLNAMIILEGSAQA